MLQFKAAFQLDDAAIDVMINQPQGEVGRWLRRKGKIMEAAAKRDVGKKTHLLQKGIYRKHSRVHNGQQMIIGAWSPQAGGRLAIYHHEGTRRHIIVGPVGKMLVFRSHGKTFRVHGVRHPGTPANKFLSKQLIFLKTP